MYLISACLCGVNCKYSGKNNLNEDCLKLLKNGEAILVCPEQLGGLTTPRPPAEIVGDIRMILGKGVGKVSTNEGRDVTEAFIKGANETVEIAKNSGVLTAILKEGSPSCGCNYIYDGSFSGKKIEGEGITSYLLKAAGIDTISDEEFSSQIKNENKLIYLSDYESKKNEDESNECENKDGSIIYSFFQNGVEGMDDIPPTVEKNMKTLIVSLAKEILRIEETSEIAEATGLTEEEVKEIISNEDE